MVYDDSTGEVVMFGGDSSNTLVNSELYTYDQNGWSQRTPSASPPKRLNAQMVYDPAIGKTVLFGGANGNNDTPYGDTWIYDGNANTWTQQSPATSPPARDNAAIAYDAATGLVVMFGGEVHSGGGTPYGDTWTYNGTTWTQQSPATSPSARLGATMVYDAMLGKIVMFGGKDNLGNALNETWTYNGTTWTNVSPATNPTGRYFATMAYDNASGQVVLFGGYTTSGNTLGDPWTYDGTAWTQRIQGTYPPNRAGASMAYSTALQQVVLFGGIYVSLVTNYTWTYQPGPFANLGSADVCSGGAPAPCNATLTMTFNFSSSGAIKAPALLTQGVANLDFTDAGTGTCTTNGVAHSYTAGTSCTVDVVFTPKAPGQRLGAVNLINAGGTIVLSTPLSGTGIAPQGLFTTPAGSVFASGLSTPRGLTVDASGNVYVDEQGGTKLDKYASGGGLTQYTVPTGSTGTAVDGAGNIFYGNGNNIFEILAGQTASVVYASGPVSPDNNLLVDAFGNLFVTSYSNNGLYEIPAATTQHTPFVVFPGGTAVTGGTTGRIIGTAIDLNNNLFLADYDHNRVYEVAAGTTAPVTLVAADGLLDNPHGITVDPAGNLYVTNASGSTSLLRYSFPFSGGSAAHVLQLSGVNGQYGAVVSGDGTLYLINGTAINKYVRTSGPTLAFGSVAVGASSAQSLQTIENDGNYPLNISSIASSNSNFTATGATSSPFSACYAGQYLYGDEVCGLGFTFTPKSTGTLSGFGNITDTTLNATAAVQQVSLSGTGTLGTKTITFPQPTTPAALNSTATLAATASNGDAVTYTITAGTATLSGSNITYTTAGTVTIAANSAATATYNAATTVSRSVTVHAPPVITFTIPEQHGITTPFTVSASSPSTGAFTYSLVSGPAASVSSSGVVTLTGVAGTVTVQVNQASDATYPAGVQTASFAVVVGSVWTGNGNSSLSALDLTGSPFSSSAGYTGGGVGTIPSPLGAAFDSASNVWVASSTGIDTFTVRGAAVNASPYTGGGISNPQAVAVDGLSRVWIANSNGTVSALTGSGVAVTPSGGFAGGATIPGGVAIDLSGNVWLSTSADNTVIEILGAAAPVAPLSIGIKNNTTGVRP